MAENKPRQCFEFLLTLRSGKNFENRKFIGSNAPFVEVSMGNETKKTMSVANLENPIWNEALGFKFEKWEDMPDNMILRVKDENTLLPNPILGEYNVKIDKAWLRNNYQQQPTFKIHDGCVNLEKCDQGSLDFQILFKYYDSCSSSSGISVSSNVSSESYKGGSSNMEQIQSKEKYNPVSKSEFEKRPEELKRPVEADFNENKKEMNYEEKSKETHVLPAIQVKDKPIIIEKEVEYHNPVEIKEKVIHQEKPIIVEQPIIKEKFEHYKEQPQVEQKQEKVVKESVHAQDTGNLDQQSLENLREQRLREFNDTTPVIHQQKEHVQLEKEIYEKPTQVKEKEVVYQQPVEINKTYVENVKPTIREDVKLHEEHVRQKLAPEMQQEDIQTVQEKQYLNEGKARDEMVNQ